MPEIHTTNKAVTALLGFEKQHQTLFRVRCEYESTDGQWQAVIEPLSPRTGAVLGRKPNHNSRDECAFGEGNTREEALTNLAKFLTRFDELILVKIPPTGPIETDVLVAIPKEVFSLDCI